MKKTLVFMRPTNFRAQNEITNFLQIRSILRLLLWGLLGFVLMNPAYCWNNIGHQVIAQIAYSYLTPEAKKLFIQYNNDFDRVLKPNFPIKRKRNIQSFTHAASWLDSLHQSSDQKLKGMHYIDLPFSEDGTPLKAPDEFNIVFALNKAIDLIKNPKSSTYEKGFGLRMVLHLIGDIHQPMHAVTRFSKNLPHGDKGGNLFFLKNNDVGSNLHAYWDRGGGLLKKKRYSPQAIKRLGGHIIAFNRRLCNKSLVKQRAENCDRLIFCNSLREDLSFEKNRDKNQVISAEIKKLPFKEWAEESYKNAVTVAYRIKPFSKPGRAYQEEIKQVSMQRLNLAGCRLGKLLNQITK